MAENLPIDSIALTELKPNHSKNHNHSRYYQSFPFRAFRERSNIERHKLYNGKWNNSVRKKMNPFGTDETTSFGYSSDRGLLLQFPK
jgi:hypothetical protein